MNRRRSLFLPLVLVLALSGVVGCSLVLKGSTATEKDDSLKPSDSAIKAGKLKIKVENKGSTEHEFVVFRTALDETDLPLNAAGDRIDEEGKGITHLDPEAEDVPVGGSKTITIDLAAGRYVFVCNLPNHYGLGMHAVVNVS